MESDDDFELRPSSPLRERKLKRLKKAVRVPECPRHKTPDNSPSTTPANSSESEIPHSDDPNGIYFKDFNVTSGSSFEIIGGENGHGHATKLDASESVKDDGLGEARVSEFDSVADDLGGNSCSTEAKGQESGDLKTDELGKEQYILDAFSEKRKRRKRVDGDRSEKNVKESTSNKKSAEKERRENLKQLRVESQRLLRETRDAAFKSIPRVHKPISSILDKIRQRKLELLKISSPSADDNNDGFAREVPVGDVSERARLGDEIADKVENGEHQETFTFPADMKNNFDASHMGGGLGDAMNNLSCETKSIPCPMVMDSEADVFRAPIDDTQELYSDSPQSHAKSEALNKKLSGPLEVFEPLIPSMNLQLDSAPPDDVSSDEEDSEKENIDPHPCRSTDLSSPPSGDPVKVFVDEEAEEEDNSDNDLMRFQDEDEDEDDEDDAEELDNMIATGFEENPMDKERRDQLHQQWLEQQDAAGMDNLLQKLNCDSKLGDTTSIGQQEQEESNETEDSEDEVEEYVSQPNAARINLEKMRHMIPQMFSDKDDAYVSSDDEETEKRLAKQCLSAKIEEQATFLSPAEDESCREVFSLIKKLNTVPDNKRKGRTTSFFDAPFIGQNINISSKSSFLNRASNHTMFPSQKHGPNKARSYIFGRDDSNSRTSISMSEVSLDTIQMESQPPKIVRGAKYKSNSQNRYHTLNSASQKSGTSLLEVLRKSSLHAERRVQSNPVQQTESVFVAFKLANKTIQNEGRV